MRIRITPLITVLPLLLFVASPVAAQSLADVARKEEARRAEVKEPAKTLTNADLKPDPDGRPVTSGPGPAKAASESGALAEGAEEAAGAAAPAAEGAAADAPPPEEKESKLDEAFWRRQAGVLRGRIETAQEALAKVNKPSTSEDPREQELLARLVSAAQSVLGRAESAWSLFQMQADAAGVPADWIR